MVSWKNTEIKLALVLINSTPFFIQFSFAFWIFSDWVAVAVVGILAKKFSKIFTSSSVRIGLALRDRVSNERFSKFRLSTGFLILIKFFKREYEVILQLYQRKSGLFFSCTVGIEELSYSKFASLLCVNQELRPWLWMLVLNKSTAPKKASIVFSSISAALSACLTSCFDTSSLIFE